MHLYELTEIYRNLMDLDLEEEELESHLKNVEDEIEVKADNIAKVLKEMEGDRDSLNTEIQRLMGKKQSLERRMDRLKDYLEESMRAVHKTKFKTALFSFNIQRNAPSLRILDESKIPEDFYRIEKKLNKKELKEALKKGLYGDAAELVQGESLRIR